MAEISVRNWNNETVRTLELSDTVFDYPLKEHLVFEAVLAYRAAGRAGTHKTKNRALGLNVVDLLDYEVVVLSEDAIKQLGEVLA